MLKRNAQQPAPQPAIRVELRATDKNNAVRMRTAVRKRGIGLAVLVMMTPPVPELMEVGRIGVLVQFRVEGEHSTDPAITHPQVAGDLTAQAHHLRLAIRKPAVRLSR